MTCILSVLLCVSTPYEDAYAMIQIAQAVIERGRNQAVLPDRPPQIMNSVDAGEEVTPRAAETIKGDLQGPEGDTRLTDAALSAAALQDRDAEPFSNLLRSSVEVMVCDSEKGVCVTGSGTIVFAGVNEAQILTCAHILDGVKNVEVTVTSGKLNYRAAIIVSNRMKDLMLCQIIADGCQAVDVGKSFPSDGAKVIAVGRGKPIEHTLLSVDDSYSPKVFMCDGIETIGRSGGGVFYGGKLIGVIKGYSDKIKRSLYVDLDEVHDFLNGPTPIAEKMAVNSEFPEEAIRGKAEDEMRLILPVQSAGPVTEPSPRAQLIVTCWERGCVAGVREKRDILSQLVPQGWKVGTDDDSQIVFKEVQNRELDCPTIELYQNGKRVKQWREYVEPRVLADEWNAAYRSSREYDVMEVGSAGAIKCREQLKSVVDNWRTYVGENIPVGFTIDRTGSASVPLLSQKEWTYEKLLGASGRFQVDCNGWKFATNRFGLGYRVLGDDLTLDADPMLLTGFLKNYPINRGAKSVGLASPVGLFVIDDIITIGSFIQAIQAIARLLNPSCDLILPNQIAGSGMLRGDVLTVEFSQPVTARLTWLFTFNLAVKKIILNLEKSVIHVDFTGSRWVKSREFAIQ